MKHVYSGKIRDLYQDDNGDLILVASDKVSVYDVVLPTPIPDKGKLLTQLSLWWFEQLADVVPNHVISSTDVPAEWAGRAVRCRPLKMLTVECIARGYLAGLGLKEYEKQGSVSGVALPAGLVEGSKLPEPIFTPTTKATEGHDEFITFDEVVSEFGADMTTRLRDLTLEIYSRGAAVARERGIIIADTKVEFGIDAEGRVVLADEVLTSDSSRFWAVDEWEPGRPGGQRAMDKQFVRDWSSTLTDWDRTYPGPEIPADIVAATRARYVEAYERITGNTWES
ncbi:phosphoribosylaminoimidazolesuccinocarboxamide synthase [Actinocatenispora rupis]|uniref:Phosphoribosylaminoimidazole-succinocarboxamide synthase n=1 Tax=Actinocatenispora rupis TaxID=519421 RepID=A0A8J3NC77_9ACTN|nr:phosphoribosylaminoimidazolesuccinocarboxamide synthase [Actinocatenispora rupis]GID14089.1 phosphoribosylaminoimidazole-succinocarboxamide synthase [Actinocatenispora rupis]